MLAIGLCAYGDRASLRGQLDRRRAAGARARSRRSLVRPHIGLIVFIGFVLAAAPPARAGTRRTPRRCSGSSGLGRARSCSASSLASQTASFLGEASLTSETVSERSSTNETQTADGGSRVLAGRREHAARHGARVRHGVLPAVPVRGVEPQALLAAGRGPAACSFLICRGVETDPRRYHASIRTTPYVAFCLGYVLAFVYAFSSFSNFGILARQRVQALPFLLVFLALPEYQTLAKSISGARATSAGRSRGRLSPPSDGAHAGPGDSRAGRRSSPSRCRRRVRPLDHGARAAATRRRARIRRRHRRPSDGRGASCSSRTATARTCPNRSTTPTGLDFWARPDRVQARTPALPGARVPLRVASSTDHARRRPRRGLRHR